MLIHDPPNRPLHDPPNRPLHDPPNRPPAEASELGARNPVPQAKRWNWLLPVAMAVSALLVAAGIVLVPGVTAFVLFLLACIYFANMAMKMVELLEEIRDRLSHSTAEPDRELDE